MTADCITRLLRQPCEELVPWERTPWHWSKHLKFRPSWLFHKGCLSLHSWQTAMLAHVGTLNSAYWALSTFQSAFIWAISFSGSMKFFQLKITLGLALGESWPLLAEPQKNTDVYKGLLPYVNLWIKFRLHSNSSAPALGRACAMGTSTIALIQTS